MKIIVFGAVERGRDYPLNASDAVELVAFYCNNWFKLGGG